MQVQEIFAILHKWGIHTVGQLAALDKEQLAARLGPEAIRMKLLRENLPNIWRASDLGQAQHGSTIQIAGNVICRQRPGTAKGFVFISLEDETGVSNAIVDPDLFERFRLVITEEAFLLIEGQVQNSDGVVLIKARDIKPLVHERLVGSESHDRPLSVAAALRRPRQAPTKWKCYNLLSSH